MPSTQVPGLTVNAAGQHIIDKEYRGVRIFARLGAIAEEDAARQVRVAMDRSEGSGRGMEGGVRPRGLARICADANPRPAAYIWRSVAGGRRYAGRSGGVAWPCIQIDGPSLRHSRYRAPDRASQSGAESPGHT